MPYVTKIKKVAEGLMLLAEAGFTLKAHHDEVRAYLPLHEVPPPELVAKLEPYHWLWSDYDECFYVE